MASKKDKIMFSHWNSVTKLCYEQNMICLNCPNVDFCNTQPWNENPYGIKNIKYATIMTLKNIGKPK